MLCCDNAGHRETAAPDSVPMAVSGTVFGAMLGLGVQFYSNAVRKLPLMRNPWEHAIALGLGGFAGAPRPPPSSQHTVDSTFHASTIFIAAELFAVTSSGPSVRRNMHTAASL